MKRRRARPVFKEYTVGQIVLLPTNLDELIPADHIARVIYAFVQKMDLAPLEAHYKGGGASSYHPKMMLAVLLLAYTQMIFSSRRIAKAMRENIAFIWISGNQQPDFHTLNDFRGRILKDVILEIFTALLKMLVEEGYVKLENYFLDGTKMEANANRYTFVWSKNTERYQRQLQEKVEALFEQIEQINTAEDAQYGERDLEELGGNGTLDTDKVSQHASQLNERLKKEEAPTSAVVSQESSPVKDEVEPPQGQDGQLSFPRPAEQAGDMPPQPPTEEAQPSETKTAASLSEKVVEKLKEVQQKLAADPHNKALTKAARQLAEDYLPRACKYEEQKRILAGRNSYSKTDQDAIFMRMKDDHLRNGQLKPGYNIQNGTEGQFVVGFSLHQQAGDTTCLIPHLEQLKQQLGRLPGNLSTDAGYGSEENYAYVEHNRMGNYVKYSSFDREQKKRYKPNPFHADSMPYDEALDKFTCPANKGMRYRRTQNEKTKNGYKIEVRVYECENCAGCELKAKCTRAAGNRQIKVSFPLRAYRQQARQNLLSEEGVQLRSQRGVDVETVFGRIKEDWKFRRFLLRGLAKVSTEWGLLCMAHNLAKVWNAQVGKMLTTQ
jgi:transposase